MIEASKTTIVACHQGVDPAMVLYSFNPTTDFSNAVRISNAMNILMEFQRKHGHQAAGKFDLYISTCFKYGGYL